MNEVRHRIQSYWGHLVKARDRHAVHSPFVYDLIAQVLRPADPAPGFAAIEQLRRVLLRSEERIHVQDLGAGSQVFKHAERRVADIARSALKSPKHAAMLFRLARYCRPTEVLELGTSFGISTLYLALGAEQGRVSTIEGCPKTQAIALQQFQRSPQRNIQSVLGDFRSRLPEVLGNIERLDLAFLDGHHAKEPTLEYFELCLSKSHNDTIIVLDDIHWSRGMEAAWEAIKAHPRSTVTIDLYDLGLVFLRKEQSKEHFVLRY